MTLKGKFTRWRNSLKRPLTKSVWNLFRFGCVVALLDSSDLHFSCSFLSLISLLGRVLSNIIISCISVLKEIGFLVGVCNKYYLLKCHKARSFLALKLATCGSHFFLEWKFLTGNTIFKNVLSKENWNFWSKGSFQKTNLSGWIYLKLRNLMRYDLDSTFTFFQTIGMYHWKYQMWNLICALGFGH